MTLGDIPPGFRVAERYAVVPDPWRTRFLVPLAGRTAAAASISRYNGLRWARLRIPRTLLGWAFRAGAGPRLIRHRLLVLVRDDLPDEALPEHLIGAHLRRVLGSSEFAMGVGVRPPDPNVKPTLQLFAPDGSPLGYAKVGWNAATRAMVVNEAATAAALGADAERLGVPAVLHHGVWRDRAITVTAPLPLRIRRHKDTATPPRLLHEVLSAPTRVGPLAESAFWHEVRAETDRIVADPEEPRLAETIARVVGDLEERHGRTPLRLGRWHGDWVPWNLGHHGGRLHVWDWEHSAPDTPLGFDHLHWRFQVTMVLEGRPLREAVRAVNDAARTELTPMGITEPELVGRLYLLEMFLRTYRLKRAGSGWNPALHPAMLDVMGEWTPSRADPG
ncbi:hypothetical protein [Thermomonospora umbrina]|uniref:hypothetical protein n=1 Tax=Thermomonospora umbrina TaxID=111806 RepID=UPI0014774594|nr:hypothetical protein [Thermomonospora umbrina]